MDHYTVVAAIIRSADSLLLVRQGCDACGDGEWRLPAGVVEGRECLESALRRELEEETGLQLTRVLRLAYTVHLDRPALGASVTAFVFEVEAFGPLAIADPDGEVLAAKYFEHADALSATGSVCSRVLAEPIGAFLKDSGRGARSWVYLQPSTDANQVAVVATSAS